MKRRNVILATLLVGHVDSYNSHGESAQFWLVAISRNRIERLEKRERLSAAAGVVCCGVVCCAVPLEDLLDYFGVVSFQVSVSISASVIGFHVSILFEPMLCHTDMSLQGLGQPSSRLEWLGRLDDFVRAWRCAEIHMYIHRKGYWSLWAEWYSWSIFSEFFHARLFKLRKIIGSSRECRHVWLFNCMTLILLRKCVRAEFPFNQRRIAQSLRTFLMAMWI